MAEVAAEAAEAAEAHSMVEMPAETIGLKTWILRVRRRFEFSLVHPE